ncbi:diguanylate cyclase [Roseovarius sp. Pro17]|uniref:diguanylate cyclase n=1 Tax=Roseovarius sp. Pro17 TaxID=3108175 RepID=UPI002D78B52A|nr:diguanylate cyclase [Roseovarius sp. Pro17]
MSGKILIVDAVATNRIVLKVKLSAAHFEVHQASSGGGAMAIARDLRPDLIIVGAALTDMECGDLIAALRARPDLAIVPIVALLPEDTGEARVAALRAGADDVISQPIDERIMLARLRGLLRQHHALQDMRLNAGPDCAAGFGEAQGGLLRAGRITILGVHMSDAMALRTRLRSSCHHQITALEAGGPVTGSPGAPAADVFVMLIPEGANETGLELMAELRASPEARHSRIVCLVPIGSRALAASLLDLGASDVIIGPAELDELTLRLTRQIQRKQAVDHLRTRLHDGLRAAMIDPLTGLYNRRFAMPFLKELAMANGSQARSFAVMLADLDHFKQINDRLGHAAGDRVLCHVADLLGSSVREVDLVARIGGEEFLIVMPGANGAEARQAADRLCRRIAEAGITIRGQSQPAHVTVSIGVAMGETANEGAEDEDANGRIDALLEQADRALYRAKARGRNTVTISARPAA